MSETEIKELVYSFCQALTLKNLDKIQSLFTDDASLYWGPYEFIGKNNILTWAYELFELFPFISFKEKKLSIYDSIAKHEFMIAFLTTQGRKGGLPCESTYTFEENKIHQLKVKLLYGFLAVDQNEIARSNG